MKLKWHLYKVVPHKKQKFWESRQVAYSEKEKRASCSVTNARSACNNHPVYFTYKERRDNQAQ
jgi:hypothetical protein